MNLYVTFSYIQRRFGRSDLRNSSIILKDRPAPRSVQDLSTLKLKIRSEFGDEVELEDFTILDWKELT